MDLPDDLAAALTDPARIADALAVAADRVRPRRPRLLAHHDLAERHPRRPEDEHDPRRHRHRRRHPHRARRHEGGRRRLLRRDPRRARRPRRDLPDPGVRVHPLPHRQPAVGRPAAPTPRSPTPAPTSCPASSPVAPTPASTAPRDRSPTARRCSRPQMTMETFGTRFHGNDERVDVESLGLSTEFWHGIATEIVGLTRRAHRSAGPGSASAATPARRRRARPSARARPRAATPADASWCGWMHGGDGGDAGADQPGHHRRRGLAGEARDPATARRSPTPPRPPAVGGDRRLHDADGDDVTRAAPDARTIQFSHTSLPSAECPTAIRR